MVCFVLDEAFVARQSRFFGIAKRADIKFQPATPWCGFGSLIKCNEISQPRDSAK